MKNYLNTNNPFSKYLTLLNSFEVSPIVDNGDEYIIKMNIPGVKKEDVKVFLEKGYLTVSYVSSSRGEHTFYSSKSQKSFFVGNNVKKEDIEASVEDGILTVTIAKKVTPLDKHNQTV